MRPSPQQTMILRSFITLTIALLIVPVFLQDVQAEGMVIAPSKIITNSSFDDGNYRNKSSNDNTVKAIIGYPLAAGCRVQNYGWGFDMTLSQGAAFEATIPAFAMRYCYIDDNLIIEFDRGDVIDDLMGIDGSIDVEVSGEFTIVCEVCVDDECEDEFLTPSITRLSKIVSVDPNGSKR